MKFNISYLGPEWLFHLRRDFILMLQYSLSDLGHEVNLSGASLDTSSINLLIGAYFLKNEDLEKIKNSNIDFINVNTEVISQDMLNFNPDKVDFLGAYLPMMRSGLACWDVIQDNIEEYRRYDCQAHFLRWGFHKNLQEISHRRDKDLDFYFFGMMSPRRRKIIDSLFSAGFRGAADHSCPYFLRNDRISRAKVNLNLVQDSKYSHVNSFRVCYLANNNCYTLSEHECDPAGYLDYTNVFEIEQIAEQISRVVSENTWLERGRSVTEAFARNHPSTEIMERLLEGTFVKH